MPDEQAIVERAKRGDRRAFEQIYRFYARVIFSYVLVPMLGDRDDAEDCLREAFIAALRAIARYEWQPAGIYPWLKTLAKNKARDLLRASGRRQRLRGAFEEQVQVEGREATNPGEEIVQRQHLRAQIEQLAANPGLAETTLRRLEAGELRPVHERS